MEERPSKSRYAQVARAEPRPQVEAPRPRVLLRLGPRKKPAPREASPPPSSKQAEASTSCSPLPAISHTPSLQHPSSLSQVSDDLSEPTTTPICDEFFRSCLQGSKTSAPGKPEVALTDRRILSAYELSSSWFAAFTNTSNTKLPLPSDDHTMSEYPEGRRDIWSGSVASSSRRLNTVRHVPPEVLAAEDARRSARRAVLSSPSRAQHASRHQRLRYPIPAGDFVPSLSPLVQPAGLGTAVEVGTTGAQVAIGNVPGAPNTYGYNPRAPRFYPHPPGDSEPIPRSHTCIRVPPRVREFVPGARRNFPGFQVNVAGARGNISVPPGLQGSVPGARGLFATQPSGRGNISNPSNIHGNVSSTHPALRNVPSIDHQMTLPIRTEVHWTRARREPADVIAAHDVVENQNPTEQQDTIETRDVPRDATVEAPVDTAVAAPVEAPAEIGADTLGEAPVPTAPAWFFTEKVDHASKDIWAPDRVGDYRLTDWPSPEELSEAGDERALRLKSRMLPIPRYYNVDARFVYPSQYDKHGPSSAFVAGTAQVPYLFRKYAVDLTGPKNRYPIPCDPNEKENARRDPRQRRRERQRQREQTVDQGWSSDLEQQFAVLLDDN